MARMDHGILARAIRKDKGPLQRQPVEHGEVMVIERQKVLAVALCLWQPKILIFPVYFIPTKRRNFAFLTSGKEREPNRNPDELG